MMHDMRKVLMVLVIGIVSLPLFAQQPARPRLVVGIVVDQMRPDFVFRYMNRYGNEGFKRILREGFNCENTFIPYTPTYTAAGHACVYTGSVPALNGIAGNNWYDKALGRSVYCTEDDSVRTVGSNSDAGRQSPKNLWSNTISDEMRLATNFRSKTIAVAIKDRGSILPGGFTANGAYWFDNASGGWITSTFYMQQLPQWMVNFNNNKLPDQYLKQNWNTLYPINSYLQSTADNKPYENNISGEDFTFPHITDTVTRNRYETFKFTPFANTYTFETARAAVEGEQLGKRGVTDMLAISFSSPDYLGHSTGPNSVEIEDMYLRFDRDLGAFLKYLDSTQGKNNYILFITADHGVAHIPGFMLENKLPAGTFSTAALQRQLNNTLQQQFGIANMVSSILNYQVYLDDQLIGQNKLDKQAIKQVIMDSLLRVPAVSQVVDLAALQTANIPHQLRWTLTNGFNQKLSGDVQFILKPNWFDGGARGTTHGSWNPYDAHIPMLWFGWGIRVGRSNREVYMTDIAPTIAALLRIQMPNATTGKVMEEVMKK